MSYCTMHTAWIHWKTGWFSSGAGQSQTSEISSHYPEQRPFFLSSPEVMLTDFHFCDRSINWIAFLCTQTRDLHWDLGWYMSRQGINPQPRLWAWTEIKPTTLWLQDNTPTTELHFQGMLINFRERGRKGEREGEEHWWKRKTRMGHLPQGSGDCTLNPQPKHVPWLGIEPSAFRFMGSLGKDAATNQATPARTEQPAI